MITQNNKISLLVNQQFPSFVREDYPLFVNFLEAYYEFLENKITLDTFVASENQKFFRTTKPYIPNTIDVFINEQKLVIGTEVITTSGTFIELKINVQARSVIKVKARNDVYSRAKELINIKDVDESLLDFQNEFFNTYLSLFPKDTDASKYVLIKNSAELYRSKGNENSFKYFFRTLFDEEIEITLPKNEVLVASGGKFKLLKVLRTTENIYSMHNGGKTNYRIALPEINFPQDPAIDSFYSIVDEIYKWNGIKWEDISTKKVRDKISVYVDGVLKTDDIQNNYWNILNLTKTTKSFNLESDQEGLKIDGFPRGIYVKPSTGTELYVLGDGGNKITQITLASAWNLKTYSSTTKSTLPGTLSIRGENSFVYNPTAISGLEFKSDGSKLYYATPTPDKSYIAELTLSEAWNVATAQNVINAYVDVGTNSNIPTDIKFKSDGTKLFISQGQDETITEYNVATPWQVNTATFFRSVEPNEIKPSNTPSIVNPQNIWFKEDGIFFYVTSGTNRSLFQYKLSEAWNIQTATYQSHATFDGPSSFLNLLAIHPAGNTFFIGGGNLAANSAIDSYETDIDYFLDRENNQVIFTRSTSNNSIINVFYEKFDHTLLRNRLISGTKSLARALIDSTSAFSKEGLNLFEFQLDQNSLYKEFSSGETYSSSVVAKDGSLINLILEPFSALTKINITDAGSKHNVGDIITIIGGEPLVEANARVSQVFSGILNKVNNIYGGAGFLTGGPVVVTPEIQLPAITSNIFISSVTTSGKESPNSYIYSDDMIYDLSGIKISNTNYKQNNAFLFSSIATPNVSSKIKDCLRYKVFTNLGPINTSIVIDSTIPSDRIVTLNALSPNTRINSISNAISSTVSLDNFGSIGRIDILSSGINYRVGDTIKIFHPSEGDINYNPLNSSRMGFGAAAFVSNVTNDGSISQIQFCPPRPAVNVFSGPGLVNLSSFISNNQTNILIKGFNGVNFDQHFANGKGALITFNIGWDISNSKFENTLAVMNVIKNEIQPRGIFLSNTGNRLFVLGDNQNRIGQIDLVANNSLTPNLQSSKEAVIQFQSLSGLKFSRDGKKFFVADLSSPPNVREYFLPTAWDISTITHFTNANLNISAKETQPRDFDFSPDGTSFFVIGTGSKKIIKYTLSTPWRINTGSFSQESISTIAGDPSGFVIHPRGNTIFVMDRTGNFGNNILHYTLSEAWNLQTMALTQVLDIKSKYPPYIPYEGTATCLAFSSDGTKMYFGGFDHDLIYQVDVSSPYTIPIKTIENSDTIVISEPSNYRMYIPNTLNLGYSTNNIPYIRTRTYDTFKIKDIAPLDCSLVTINKGSKQIVGSSTNFIHDFKVNDKIIIKGQIRTIESISSDSLMNVTTEFDSTISTGTREIGNYSDFPLGGLNYDMKNLPLAEMNNDEYGGNQGSGAIFKVTAIMGDGENLRMSSNKKPGEIEAVEITNNGIGYNFTPILDFTKIGDGTAKGTAVVEKSFFQYPGVYLNSDGHISGDKKLQDSVFYNSGTYVIKTKQQFIKFKNALLNLIHPVGKYVYCLYSPIEVSVKNKTPTLNISTITLESPVNTTNLLLNLDFNPNYYTVGNTTIAESANNGIFTLDGTSSSGTLLYKFNESPFSMNFSRTIKPKHGGGAYSGNVITSINPSLSPKTFLLNDHTWEVWFKINDRRPVSQFTTVAISSDQLTENRSAIACFADFGGFMFNLTQVQYVIKTSAVNSNVCATWGLTLSEGIGPVKVGQWTQLVVTKNTNTFTAYVNGLTGVTGATGTTQTILTPIPKDFLYIAKNTTYANGLPLIANTGSFAYCSAIDFGIMRMYNTALSSNDIKINYDAFKSRFGLL